jgi:hypothetical protein
MTTTSPRSTVAAAIKPRTVRRTEFSSSLASATVALLDTSDGQFYLLMGSGREARRLSMTRDDLLSFIRWVAERHDGVVVVELPGADDTAEGSYTQLGVVHPTIGDDGSPLVGFMANKDHLAVTPRDAEHAAAALLACARRPADLGVIQRAILADVIAGATGLSPGCTEAWQQSVAAIADAVLDRFDLMPREA